MHEDMARAINLPKGVPTARYIPPPQITVPVGQELPLIDSNHPDGRKVQEVWTARVQVFDMSKAADASEVEQIWQRVTDGRAKMAEFQTNFDPKRATYVSLLRWIDLTFKLPPTSA